jgi:hypothetical protein
MGLMGINKAEWLKYTDEKKADNHGNSLFY